MAVTYGGATYYYATNIQGDVVAILNASGTAVVTYTYDAWGNILTTTGTLASTLGTHNPLRYRGYVFDQETGLYYLQTRYYNPELGRFLSADAFVSTGQGILGNNMFAYCLNNPCSGFDPYGNYSKTSFDNTSNADDAPWKIVYSGYDYFVSYQGTICTKNIQFGVPIYKASDKNAGAKVIYSHNTRNLIEMYDFIESHRGEEVSGTTFGIMWEWIVHNAAYDFGVFLDIKTLTDRGKDLDIGNTIYDDNHGIASLAMEASYFSFAGYFAWYDLWIYMTSDK